MQNRVVTFRLSSAEFAQISAHSARAGLSISASVRALVLSSIGDKKSDQILDRLASIQRQIETPSVSPEPPKNEQIDRIAQALVGLVENHFLPLAAVDRKPQIREILQILKGQN